MFEKVSELQKEAVDKFFSEETSQRLLVGFPVGVGKTVVAINITKKLLEDTNGKIKTIAVVPANLRPNFIQNIEKFGLNKLIKATIISSVNQLYDEYSSYNFFIMSYNFAAKYYEKILEKKFDFVIFDEAHYGKNDSTLFSKAMKELCFNIDYVLLLTASFISNRLTEFGRMLYYVTKQNIYLELRTIEEFDLLKKEIKKHAIIIPAQHVDKYVTRPKPIYEVVKIPLDSYTEKVYDIVMKSRNVTSVIDKIKIGVWNTREIRNVIIMLQQVLLTPDYIQHDFNPDLAQHVGSKVTYCAQHLRETKGVKTIVFVPFVRSGAIVIRKYFKSQGIDCEIYHGELSTEERQELIDRFENGDLNVLILTLAGREGINLPSTKQIIFLGYSWNPEDITQVVGRALRVTSNNKYVYVYFYENVKKRFLILNDKTIDGIMLEVIREKQNLKMKVEDTFGVVKRYEL